MPLAGKRPGARRVAAALFGLGGDALARGARAVTGRGAPADSSRSPTGGPPSPAAEAPPDDGSAAAAVRVAAAEEAAARLDAARERLRATIAPPQDDLAADDLAADERAPDERAADERAADEREPDDSAGDDASRQPPPDRTWTRRRGP